MTETELAALCAAVTPPDEAARAAAHAHWASLAKPLGGLGGLETTIEDAAALTGSAKLDISCRAVLVLCADNGVVAQGVSQTDSSVTRVVAQNLAARRTSVCRMAAAAHCDVMSVDMGIAGALVPGAADCRIAAGTADFTTGPAMTRAQAVQAIAAGIALVRAQKQSGAQLLATGEMGIGNTTTSSAVASVLLGRPVAEMTGRGAGLSDAGLQRKIDAIERGIARNHPDAADPLGVLAALAFCVKQKERYGIKEDDLMDGVLWGVPLAIVGARLYYVLFYLDRFKKEDGSFDWAESVAIWDGGLAIYGGVIAAVLVCLVLSKKRGFKLGALTDLVVMGLLIGQAIGRWGNFMNREAFGAETTLPWRMQLTTTAGTLVEVHPTFLYESLWNVIGLLLIVFIVAKGRRFDGENTWFYFLWYGIGRFWIEGLRTDSLYLFNWTIGGEPIRVSQALSLVMVLVAAFMLFYNIRLHPHKPEELYVNMAAAKEAAADTKDETPAEGE